jgi:hypothetical protein
MNGVLYFCYFTTPPPDLWRTVAQHTVRSSEERVVRVGRRGHVGREGRDIGPGIPHREVQS